MANELPTLIKIVSYPKKSNTVDFKGKAPKTALKKKVNKAKILQAVIKLSLSPICGLKIKRSASFTWNFPRLK